jgi:phosphate transport system protein
MDDEPIEISLIDRRVAQLFALVSEALARATHALLNADPDTGRSVVEDDEEIDELTAEVERLVWAQIDSGEGGPMVLRHLVSLLLILPELERSADLAEHIAQRAVTHLGAQMSPLSRGIVQRMAEVAVQMWHLAADAYADRSSVGPELEEADEEIDILHDRLTREIETEAMGTAVAAQVTLVARFYERLGDHAVNLAHRIGSLPDS